MPTVNLERLDQTFARLSTYSRRKAAFDSRFRDLIVNETDDDHLFRINAHQLAAKWSVPTDHVIVWLLYASRVGLFDLNWESHCAHCTGLTELDASAGKLSHSVTCSMCQAPSDVNADENIQITFTISPSIRQLAPSLKGFVPDYVELRGIYVVSGPLKLTLDTPGQFFLVDSQHDAPGVMARFDVEPANPPRAEVAVTFHPEIADPRQVLLAPGDVTFHITGTPKVALVYRDPKASRVRARIVTALDVMLLPDFKEIFSNDTLSQRESLSIRSLTIMFTDITGSTTLYNRLGDARAYNLVRDHFEVLFNDIEAHHGVVIKTIGDAVMAAFHNPESALEAALYMQNSIRAFNEKRDPEGGIVLVKIGLHTGSAIAVNLNNALDYFGNMVNLAARIQSKSRSEEVLMSEETHRDPSVAHTLAADPSLVVSESLFDLHGIGETRLVSVMAKL